MKKTITISMMMGLILALNLSAQINNGPGNFETFEYNFNDGSMAGWVKGFALNEWVVAENPRTEKNELHWIRPTFARTGYNFNGYGAIYEDATFENFEMTFQITSLWNNRTGMIFNWQDSLNFNVYYVNRSDGRTALFERTEENGVNFSNWDHSLINTFAPDAVDLEDPIFTVRLRHHEGKTSVWLGDRHIFNSVPMSEFNGGKIGVYGFAANEVFFDSIKVVSTYNLESCEATLSELTASAGVFYPEEFSPIVREYFLTVPGPATEVTLTAVASHEKATVAGDGVVSVPGVHEIVITAEDGTEFSYTVTVLEGDPVDPGNTVVSIIDGSADHTTLATAITEANLVDALSAEGPFTVFAPTNDAFAELDGGFLDDLLADPSGTLTDILLYHVVPAKALSGDLEDGQMLTTLQGQSLAVTFDGDDILINGAKVIAADLEADNGVVHVIDAVLVPEPSLIYSLTIPLAAGEVPYKYFVVPNDVTESWDLGEWPGDPNRMVVVAADVTLNDVWGVQPNGDENGGDDKNAADDTFMVTFNVEMYGAMVGFGEDAVPFDPELHRVFIAGGFGGDIEWNQPGSNPDLEMTVEGGEVSVEENRQVNRPAVVLYPNPANNHVAVNAGTGNINRVEVFNLTGSRVLARDINNANYNLDVSDFTSGIYIVRVFTDNAGIVNQKLQIIR